jgi:hypothetical protein
MAQEQVMYGEELLTAINLKRPSAVVFPQPGPEAAALVLPPADRVGRVQLLIFLDDKSKTTTCS